MEDGRGIVNRTVRMYMLTGKPQEEYPMPTYHSPEDQTDGLHRLLLRAVPENKHGNKTILFLAELLGLNRWSINKWVGKNRISPERVVQLVEISKIQGFDDNGKPILGEPRVAREDFDPFVYNF